MRETEKKTVSKGPGKVQDKLKKHIKKGIDLMSAYFL